MTVEDHAREAIRQVTERCYDGEMETWQEGPAERIVEAAIRAAGEPLAAALRDAMYEIERLSVCLAGLRDEAEAAERHSRDIRQSAETLRKQADEDVAAATAALAAWEAK